jgi:2'-5' RNA ligase
MRLFVAMDPTAAVREAIVQFCEKVKPALSDARWVRPEGIHVTLKFIGEVDDSKVPAIRDALSAVHSAARVELSFHGVGFFPEARRPRVFWAGVEASPSLAEIVAQIESRLEPLGIARESRKFQPHLTLARIEKAGGVERLHAELLRAGEPQFGTICTGEFHLMQSELGRGGARYTKIETYDFAVAQ